MQPQLAGEEPEDQQRKAAEVPIAAAAAADAEQTRQLAAWWRVFVLVLSLAK